MAKLTEKKPSTILVSHLKPKHSTIINELILAFFGWIVRIIYAWFAIARFIFERTQAYRVF